MKAAVVVDVGPLNVDDICQQSLPLPGFSPRELVALHARFVRATETNISMADRLREGMAGDCSVLASDVADVIVDRLMDAEVLRSHAAALEAELARKLAAR